MHQGLPFSRALAPISWIWVSLHRDQHMEMIYLILEVAVAAALYLKPMRLSFCHEKTFPAFRQPCHQQVLNKIMAQL